MPDGGREESGRIQHIEVQWTYKVPTTASRLCRSPRVVAEPDAL
jgi:hypothetical protein